MLEEQRLVSRVHDRRGFDCGIPVLNEYLQRYASQHRRRGIAQTYVLVDSADPAVVLGYYTLSAAQVDCRELNEIERKRLPRFPIPCFRMGRFACRKDRQGEGLGKLLIGCAVDRRIHAREEVAAYALVVDAKNDAARAFYEHFGFEACQDRPDALYLPLEG